MNIEQEAHKLEKMSAQNQGESALRELQSIPQNERLEIIKHMQQDARQEQGKVYIDNDQLVFDSPFNSARRAGY